MPLRRRVIPGFGLAFGTTILYLGVIVLLPLCALILKASGLGFDGLWRILTLPRTLSALRVTISMALLATLFNAISGRMLAWVLAR
jgi:sulfate transport system permease protein